MIMNIINKVPHYGECRNVIFKFWKENKKLLARGYFVQANSEEIPSHNIQEDASGTITAQLFNGSFMTFSGGKFAKLADGSAEVRCNDTTVMATAVADPKSVESSFVPLTVSYRQKAAALGRIPLNHLRREIGQTEYEILTSRIIDRSVRPLFPKGFHSEVQVICNPLSLDGNTFPDVLAINAASAALAVSDIPWNGPVAAVRVGLIGDQVLINPNKQELSESTLNLIVACRKKKKIIMLEGSAKNVYNQDLLKAVGQGLKECLVIIGAINKLAVTLGKEKQVFAPPDINPSLIRRVRELADETLKKIFMDSKHHKLSRDKEVFQLEQTVMKSLKQEFSFEDMSRAAGVFQSACKDVFREVIWETGIRCDGRKEGELRPITCEVDLYKPLHGSALFQRGQTQVLCTVALDSPNSALKMDKVAMLTSGVKEKNFFLHYEFPPFATKEVKKLGPLGRREIGHGALAEKALRENILRDFPFTIRLTAEVLESNGSSSMASVCGGSLALMDAGVPISHPVAGVALGLLVKYSQENPSEIMKYKILTDIMGIEDYFGDMDFKLAGTQKAITALQMDLKTDGISIGMLSEIILSGKNAIVEILKEMNKVCGGVRVQKKSNWPEMEKINVPPHQRSKFIGAGGIHIKKLELEVGVEITEEKPGEFCIFAANKDAMVEAKQIIEEQLTTSAEPTLEFGGVYAATITEIREHGCMVTLYPGMTPVLIPVTQLDHRRVNHPSALGMNVGQEINVKYFGRDPVSGVMRLSRKVLQGVASEIPRSFTKKEQSKPEKSLPPIDES